MVSKKKKQAMEQIIILTIVEPAVVPLIGENLARILAFVPDCSFGVVNHKQGEGVDPIDLAERFNPQMVILDMDRRIATKQGTVAMGAVIESFKKRWPDMWFLAMSFDGASPLRHANDAQNDQNEIEEESKVLVFKKLRKKPRCGLTSFQLTLKLFFDERKVPNSIPKLTH